ncbi:hypothetical protein BDZ89DRAFT_1203997 [Hymenopellis radicata]|nr:hypothetical protein BDZ89DRAFT_1203997 [Hymenopellis radicata]
MTRLALLLALLPAVLAFKDTIPIVAWSTHTSTVLDKLSHTGHALESILLSDDICSHEAVVIVDQPGLHASDLRSLPPTSHISRSLTSSASSHQRPYVPVQQSGDLVALAQMISERCAARLVTFAPGISGVSLDKNEKAVVVINLPGLTNEGYTRKGSMLHHDQLLADAMESMPFETQLTLFSSSVLPHHKRQAEEDEPPVFPSASKKGGILARYQLLTPALITTLLVVLFVLLPLLYFGISALASIQSPVRMDAPKGYSAGDKKNQ